MPVIGIVGGMGSGKSTVVGLINEQVDAYIINADHIGHDLLKKGRPAYNPVLKHFGPQVLGKDEEIDRKILGQIVFSDPKKLEKLNQISHPLIYQTVKEQIDGLIKEGSYQYIIVDAALLIEIKLVELVDQVWGVYLPVEMQIKRVMRRNGLSEQEAKKRIASQLPWNEIKKVIDAKIDNSASLEETKNQIYDLLDQISKGI